MSKSSSKFRKIKSIIYIGVTIAIILAAVTVFSNFTLTSKNSMSNSSVLTKVKAISELNTVEMYFNEILDYKDSLVFNDFEIPFTAKSFIFTVESKVKAGIDLSQLSAADVMIDKKKITLKLPTPVVTSKEILVYKAFDEKNGLFNEVTNEDTLKVLNEFTDKLDETAIASGILEKAKESATSTVTGLLEIMGFDDVSITY